MSRIARNLCHDLVEPSFKRSLEKDPKRHCSFSSRSIQHTPSIQDGGKPTRTIIVENKKVINNLVPNDLSASRTKFKFRETLLRKVYADTAVNTVVTGPLRCDNNCVTMVRKRDNKFSCRCGQKRINSKVSTKLIQTQASKKFSHTDKACTQCVETASCGTQFFKRVSGLMSPLAKTEAKKSMKDIIRSSSKDMPRIKLGQATSNNHYVNPYMGARRWALSQYPMRGPDF